MAVRDYFQRQGVGSALMQAAVDTADNWLNIIRLELEAAQMLAESERQLAEEQTSFANQLGKRAKYLTRAFVVALIRI